MRKTSRLLPVFRRHLRVPVTALMLGCLSLWTVQVRGATLIWDTDTATGAPTGGTDTWDQSLGFWDNGIGFQTWSNAADSTALFGGVNSTVTLGEAISAAGLLFKSNYRLTSAVPANTLTLTAGTVRTDMGMTATIDSQLLGTAGLTKTGGGALRLSNVLNSYTGPTVINDGSVIISNPAALGTDTTQVVINGSATRGFGGGQLVLEGNYGTGMNFTRDLSLQGLGPITDRSGALSSVMNNTISGTITTGVLLAGTAQNTLISSAGGRFTLAGNLNFGGTAATTFTTFGGVNGTGVGSYAITGVLAGSGSIQKQGGGTLILNPSDATGYSGTIRLSAGSVRVTSPTVFGTNAGATTAGTIDMNGGILEVLSDTNFTTTKNIYHRAGTSTIFTDHAVAGLAINGTTTFAAMAFEENLTMNFNSRNGYGVTIAATPVQGGTNNSTLANNLTGGGLLTFTGAFWSNADTTSRTMTISGNGNTLISGNVTASSATAGVDFSLTKTGTGTLTVTSTAATLDGNLNVNGGTVALTDFRSVNMHSASTTNNGAINIGTGATAGILSIGTATAATAAGLTLLTGKAINLAGTTGSATINASQAGANPVIIGTMGNTGAGAKTLTLGGTNTADNAINGVLADNAANILTLVKTDPGTWALGGNNTYTGTTTISGGTLKLKATAAASNIIASVAAVTFNANATTQAAGGTLEFVGQAATSNVESLGALTPTAGMGTVKVTPGSGGTSSLTFTSLGTVAGVAGVNFITPNAATNIITLTGQAASTATTLPGTGKLYINGADFATINASAQVVAPTYAASGNFQNAGAALVSAVHNRLAGSIASQSAVSVSSLKIDGAQTLNMTGNLTITTGGLLQTGGTGTLSGTAVTTGGATPLAVRVNLSTDVLNLSAPILVGTTGGLTKNGAGTLVLSGANAQTGATTINEGTIRLSGTGTLSGASQDLTIRQGATLDLNGVSTGATIKNLVGAGKITNGNATAATLTVGNGTPAASTFSGVIENGTGGAVSVFKRGTVAFTFSGLNTYTGSTTIESTGSLTVTSLASIGQPSGIGAGNNASDTTNAASLVFQGPGASPTPSLIYTGTTSVSIDRLFTLDIATVGGTAVISNNSGTNAALVFNKTNPIVFGPNATTPQALTLGGSSTADNQMNLQIVDNAALATSVVKTGAGQWVLGNTSNIYTGTTAIAQGILIAKDFTSLPNASGLLLGATTNPGVLQTSGDFIRNVAAAAAANTVTWNGTTGGGGFAASDAKLVVALGGTGAPTALTWGSGGFVGTGGVQALILNSTTAMSEVEWRNPVDLAAGTRTIQVDENTNTLTDYATITGVISGAAGSNISKTGAGTLQLFGANTYTGTTAVTAGQLVVNTLGNTTDALAGTSVGTNAGANTAAQAITLGNGTTGVGVLQYVGAGETSDRMIRLNTTTGSNQIHADGSGALVLTNVLNDMTAGAKTLTLRGSNTAGNTISSILADNGGTLGVTIDGGATWVLTAANTMTGTTSVNAGALGIGNDAALGTGTLSLSNSSVFAYGADRSISNAVTHANNTTQAFIGDNNLTFTGTYTNASAANSNAITNNIVAGKALTLGAVVNNAITAARTLTFNGSGDTVISGDITTSTAFNLSLTYSGTGSIKLNGTATDWNAGTLTLSSGKLILGANEVIPHGVSTADSGNVVISPIAAVTATLDLNGKTETVNGLTGTGAGTMIIDNSSAAAASLIVGGNDQVTQFNGSITRSGTGTLSLGKIGTAIATFAGPADVTAFDVQGGSLKVNGGITTPTAVTGVTVAGGALLQLYDGAGTPFPNLTTLNLGAGAGIATLELDAGTTTDTLTTSAAAIVANTIKFNIRDVGLSPGGIYPLLVAPSGLTGTYTLGPIGGYTGSTLSVSDTLVQLNLGTLVSGSMFWTGAGLAPLAWNSVDGGSNGDNWSSTKNGLTLSTTVPGAGTTVVFQADNAASATAGLPLATTLEQSFRINNLVVETATNPQPSISIAPGVVTTNRLTIQPVLSTDGIEVKTGTAKGVTISAQLAAGSAQTWNVADFNSVALTNGVTVTGSPNVVVGSTAGLVPGMQIVGPGIPTGATIIQVVDGTNIVISANATGQNAALQNYTATSSLNISGGLFGSGNITKTGSGRVVLSGAGNTYTGTAVNITGGILETQNVTALGGVAATPSTGATITIGAGAEFRHNSATAGTIANPLVLNGGMLSVGGFTSNATTLALTAVNHTYSGTVSMAADSTVNMADLATHATLSHAITLSGVVSGTGKLTVNSVPTVSGGNQLTGSVALNANNSGWSGGALVQRGTLQTNNQNGFGTGQLTFNPFGKILWQGTNATTWTIANNILVDGGAVGEINADNISGTVTSPFAANYTGVLTIGGAGGAGAARLFAADGVNSPITLMGGVVLANNGSISAGGGTGAIDTISTVGISESGGSRTLTINDNSTWATTLRTLAINVAGTYTGGTNLAGGTLILGNKDALGTGGLTITAASTIQGGVDLSGPDALPYATTLSGGLTVSGTNNITFANTVTQNGGDRTLTNSLTTPAALLLTNLRLAEVASAAARNLTVAGTGTTTITNLVNNDQNNTLTNSLTTTTLSIGTIALSDSALTGRTLTLGGAGNTTVTGLIENISGGGGLAGGLTKTGAGVLTPLAANTFGGDLAANGGFVDFSTVSVVGGPASNLGQGTNINLGGGALRFIGAVSQSTDRPITLTVGSTLTANGTGGATITYTGAVTGAGNSLTLDGSGDGFLNGLLTQTGTAADINKNGTGTWTLGAVNMIADDINANAGVLNINASQNFLNTATTASNHIVVTGTTAVVNLNAANSHLGDDLFIRSGATVNLGISGAMARESVARGTDGMRNLLIGDSGTTDMSTLDLKGFTSATGTVAIGTDTIPGQIIDSVGGGNLNSTGYTVRLGGTSGNLSGTATMVKNGGGIFTLSGTNTFTGATTVTEGSLVLDYTTNNTSKIATAAGVTVGGAAADANPTLTINGSATTPTTQAFTTLTVIAGANNIVVNSNGGQAANLNFTTITRTAVGGTVDFTLPAVGAITTTQALNNGILGGYATVGNGTAFATKDGSNIIQAAVATLKNDVTTWLSADNVTDDATGFTGTVLNCAPVNSVTYTGVGSTVNSVGLIGINSGGILVTAASTGSKMLGGVLTSGTVSDVIVNQYAAGDFEISSSIRGINAITKAGTGNLLLSGTNTGTGTVNITEGLVKVSGGKAIGDTAAVNIRDVAGAGLQLLASETIGSLAGGGLAGGTLALGSNTLTINEAAATTFGGVISGNGTIVKQGTANLNFDVSTSPAFTGSMVINQGLIFLSGNGLANMPAVSSITANQGGAFLLDFNSGTTGSNRVNDAAAVNLSSQGNGTFFGLQIRSNQDASHSETIGAIILNGGSSVIGVAQAGGTGRTLTLTGASLIRQNNATLFIDGRNLAVTSGDNRGRMNFTAAPTLVGGAGVVGGTATNVPIIRYAVTLQNPNVIAIADVPNTFASYGAAGTTPLNIATEYRLDSAGYTASADVNDNLRFTAGATGLVTKTFNAAVFDSSTAAMTVSGAGGGGNVLTVGSGAMLFTSTVPANGTTLDTFDALTPGTNSSNEWIITTANTTATINSVLTDGTAATALTKSGSGTLVLGGTNTYTGATYFNQGIVRASAIGNLGNGGALNFFGGTLQFGGVFDPSARAVNISAIGGGATFDTNGNDIVLAGAIGGAGTGSLTKTGLGNLTLNAAATHTGGTTVINGTLTAGVADMVPAASSLTVNGATATLDLATFNQSVGTFTLVTGAVNGTATLTASDYQLQAGTVASTVVLAGTAGATKTTAGTVTLGGSNTFSGQLAVQAGTISFDSIANANGTASALGAPATATNGAIQMGLGTAATGLTYTGAGHSSDRIIALVGTTGATTISANGTGALSLGAVTSFEFGAKSLVLRGTSTPLTVVNKITSAITECLGVVTLQKLDPNTWQLDAANTYTGATQIDDGVLRVGINNALPAATAVRLGTGATAGTLDLNGFDQTIGSLTSSTNSAVVTNNILVTPGKTLTINGAVTLGANAATSTTLVTASGGGDVVVNSSGGTFQVGGATGATNANTATVDFTGLANFTANLGATGTFRIGDVTTGTVVAPSTMKLPANNTITAGSIRVGDSSGPSSVDTLTLGTGTNTLNADLINIGSAGAGIRSSGLLNFAAGDTTGTVMIRASDGTSAATFNMVNTTGSTTGNIDSTVNFAGHTADLKFTTVTLAARSVNTGAATATLTFDQGFFDAATLNIASRTGAGTGNATGTVNLGDSAAPGSPTTTIGAVNMAVNTSAGGTVTADLNVTGGNVTLGPVNMANAATSRTATSTIDLTGGTTTLTGDITRTAGGGTETATVTLDGGTLDMGTKNIGTGAASITLVAASGTLKNLGELNGGGAFSKTTAGTLTLEGVNTHTGDTTVSAGTLVVNNSNVLTGSGTGTGAVTVDVLTTLAGNGSIAPASGKSITLNGTTVVGTPGSSTAEDFVMTVAGTANLAFNGTIKFDIFANSETGTLNTTLTSNDLLKVSAADWNNVLFGGVNAILKVETSLLTTNWQQGDAWKIFDWSGVAGTAPVVGSGGFTTPFDLPVLDSGKSWNTSQLYTTGVISIDVIPEPSRMMLLLFGLLGLCMRRRRK